MGAIKVRAIYLLFIKPNALDIKADKYFIDTVKKYDNVYLDLCDIHRHSGIVDKMVENVGADKVLYGTDAPWYDHMYCLGSVLFSHISDDDKYKILNANAAKLAERK